MSPGRLSGALESDESVRYCRLDSYPRMRRGAGLSRPTLASAERRQALPLDALVVRLVPADHYRRNEATAAMAASILVLMAVAPSIDEVADH